MDKHNICGYEIYIVRKKIKNIYLTVQNTGKIRISCPIRTSISAIEQLVESKLDWIKKQKVRGSNFLVSNKKKYYINDEEHYLYGKKYYLNIIEDNKNYIILRDNIYIEMHIKDSKNLESKKKLLYKFYREVLTETVQDLIIKWSNVIGVSPKTFNLRCMKTRWGSCNIQKKHILINTELVKVDLKYIEYIVVHELLHLLERYHNANFYSLMSTYLPRWKEYKKGLDTLILS